MVLTGSTGFVGRALIPRLAEKHRLICPERPELNLTAGPVDLDILVKENEAEFVIHLAHPRLYNLLSAMSEAILMTRNVLEVSRLNDLPLLYLSGLVIFSGHHDTLNISSQLQPLPESVYGQTKFLCEQLVETYKQLYDLQVIVLRPSYLYGSGMDRTRALYKFLCKAVRHEPITVHMYANGFQVFDFLHIDDFVDAIVRSIEKMPRSPVNIGTGIGTGMLELAQIAKGVTRSKSEIRIVNVDSKTSKLVVDPANARDVLGWKATTPLRNGLESLAVTVNE